MLTWRELIPSCPLGYLNIRVSYEHITTAPLLTLHIAVALHPPVLQSIFPDGSIILDDDPPPPEEVSVWRVSPDFDGQGVICGLQSERLYLLRHSLQVVGTSAIESTKLQGDYVVLCLGDFCRTIHWRAPDGLAGSNSGKVVRQELCLVRVFKTVAY